MELEQKIDKIYECLVGNDLGNDGLISRVQKLEKSEAQNKKIHITLASLFTLIQTIFTFKN
jgi:hypothetical protein